MGIILKEPWIPWKTMENYGKKNMEKTMETPWKHHENEENHGKKIMEMKKAIENA